MRSPQWARYSRRLALGLVGVAVAAAVALPMWQAAFSWAARGGNLERLVNRRPERLVFTWTAVTSPLPGRFAVRGLRLVGHTPRVDWEVTADEAVGDLAWTPLLWRELRFLGVTGRGVAVRVARRGAVAPAAAVVAGPAQSTTVRDPTAQPHDPSTVRQASPAEAEPPEAGSAVAPSPSADRDPALADPAAVPPVALPPLPRTPPWSFVFPDLEVTALREVRIDDRRLTLTGQARGGFSLRERTFAEIDALDLEVDGGHLEDGPRVLAEELRARVRGRILPWRYRGARLVEVGRRFAGHLEISGRLATDGIVAYLLGDLHGLGAEAAPGELVGSLHLQHGAFLPGSTLTLRVPRLAARLAGLIAEGDATITAATSGSNTAVTLASAVLLPHWSLARAAEAAFLVGEGLSLTARAAAPRLDALPRAAGVDVELGRARLPDLAALQAMLPESLGVALEQGAVEVGGQLHLETDLAASGGRVDVRGAGLVVGVRGQRFAGDLVAELALSAPDLAAREVGLDGSRIELRDFAALTSAGRQVRGWSAQLELPESRLTFARPVRAAGRFRARLSDSRPLIALYELRRDLPAWAEHLLTLENVTAQGAYGLGAGRLEVIDAVVPVGDGLLRATLDLERARRRGRLLLGWRRLALGVELDASGRRWRLRDAAGWYETGLPAASRR